MMHAAAFRRVFEYHLRANDMVWHLCDALDDARFDQQDGYGHGSIRAELMHLLDVDLVWFSALHRRPPGDALSPAASRAELHRQRHAVATMMRAWLAALDDAHLFQQPIREPAEDRGLFVWQVLIHVINHGTDHRAQLLRRLHDLGVATPPQDFIFDLAEH
ncbi:MAG: DinB family protein [Chloroflexi bacterium]|nr:DinB family protein [Chloroflexota bacterium]